MVTYQPLLLYCRPAEIMILKMYQLVPLIGSLLSHLSVRSPRFRCLSCCGLAFASKCSFHTGILHSALMVRNPLNSLPVRLQEFDSLDWVQAGIVHPVVCLAEPSKIVRRIIRRVVI